MSIAALSVLALVGGVLGIVAFGPSLAERLRAVHASRRDRLGHSPRFDPGRELRAERKALELLRSVVSEEDCRMYEELGFLRLRPSAADGSAATYAYLIYPHRPIVSYEVAGGRPLSEYCIDFPDRSDPELGTRLPDADDVLAKWMSLRSGEAQFLAKANLHQPGRQIDPARVAGDINRVEAWLRAPRRHSATPGSSVVDPLGATA